MNKRDALISITLGIFIAFFLSLRLYASGNILLGGFEISPLVLFVVFPVGSIVGYAVAAVLFKHVGVLKQFARFGLIGVSNFSIDLGLLSFLTYLTGITIGWQVIPLNTLAAGTAIVNSYVWNRTWTFNVHHALEANKFTVFLIISLIGLLLNDGVVYVVINAINPYLHLPSHFVLDIAKIAATILVLFWNFFGYKYIVFRDPVSI